MTCCQRLLAFVALPFAWLVPLLVPCGSGSAGDSEGNVYQVGAAVTVASAVAHDVSPSLASLTGVDRTLDASPDVHSHPGAACDAPAATQPTAASVEQKEQGARPAPDIVESFDGLGEGFQGPQGTATFRN